MSSETRHKQVKVCCKLYNKNGSERLVDEQIAPLLLALWDRGICPSMSCQETKPGFMWIEFFGSDSFKKFMDILLDGISYKNLDLYNRIMGDVWIYEIFFYDDREDLICEDNEDGPTFINPSYKSNIDIFHSIRFPISDFDMVLKAFSKKRSSS